MNKAILEFKEKYKEMPEIDHVIDFLKDQYSHKKSINFNYEQALEKANEWTRQLNEKNKNLKNSGLVETVMSFDNGFRIVRLIDQDAKNWEGLNMNHCVASDSYQNHEGIYSLRDKDNYPHCTIEIKNNKIQQIKGKSNGFVSPKYVDFVLDFLKSKNLKISNYDIENLGYTNRIDLNFIKNHFSNYKIIKMGSEEFLYVGNQLKLEKKFKEKKYSLLIHFCEFNQCFEAVKIFVQNGADIHFEFERPLRVASLNGHLDIVKFLVEKGADIQANNNCALYWAIRNRHLEVVKFLVEKGADIQAEDNYALRWSSHHGHLDIVKFLVEKGVDIYFKNNLALRLSSEQGCLEIVKYLVEKGADVHAENNYALRWASKNGHLDVVKFLVQNGADISVENHSAFHSACENGHLEIVKFLFEKGADIHSVDNYALRWASKKGHLAVVKFLIENGADIFADNNCALDWATQNGHMEIVNLLNKK